MVLPDITSFPLQEKLTKFDQYDKYIVQGIQSFKILSIILTENLFIYKKTKKNRRKLLL